MKKINYIILLIFLLLITNACSTANTDTPDQGLQEETTLETEKDTQTTAIESEKLRALKKEIPEIGTPLSEGLLNQLLEDKKSVVLKEKTITTPLIDLSDQIQWQVDHLDTLSTTEKDLLFAFLFPDLKKTSTSVSWFNDFIQPVYAIETEPYEYGIEFDDQVTFLTIDMETRNLYSEILRAFVFEAMAMYEQVLDMSYLSDVKIILEPLNPGVDAIGYKMEGQIGEYYIDEYRIHLNLNLSTDMILASLSKELFRGYLYDYGYTNTLNQNHQFARHAGALWAVTLFEDYDFYDYYNIYTEDLYQQNSLHLTLLDQPLMKSFYQIFYFLYQEQGDLDRVQNLFARLLEDIELCQAMKKPGEKSIHNLFANLMNKLFLTEDSSSLDFHVDSPFATHTFSDQILEITIPEGLDYAKENEPWSQMVLGIDGFRVFYFDVPSDETGKVTLLSNLKMDPTMQNTGMVVYKLVDETWQIGTVDTPYDLDFASGTIDGVAVVFFQYGPGMEHEYLWDYTDQINGEGTLRLTYHMSNDSETATTSTNVVLSITEDIQLIVDDAIDGTEGYTRLATGDVYQINALQMNISGTIKTQDKILDFEEVTSLSGTYHYDHEFHEEVFDNPLIQIPDLSSPTGLIDEAALDAIKEATEALPGLVGDDAAIDIPSIPDLDEANEAFSAMELPKINRLMRIKWMPTNGMLHFYKNFPPSAFTTPWVQAIVKHTTKNAAGEIEVNTYKEERQLDEDYFNVWLYNPSYDPMAEASAFENMPTTQEAFIEEYDSIEAITEQISAINGKFNMYNLYPGMNKGLQTIQISDFKKGLTGTQDQNIHFDEEQLKGTMSSRFKDAAGTVYNISINFKYDF